MPHPPNPLSLGVPQALYLLGLFLAISLMLGGMRGGRWAWRLITAPVRQLLTLLEQRIAAYVAALVLVVLGGLGVLHWLQNLLH